jgi:nucleoside-diphosphate-sugar epimerase
MPRSRNLAGVVSYRSRMDVVVAGGRGFVGRATCAWLEANSHSVQVAGRGDRLDFGDVVVHLGLFDEATTVAAVAQLRGRPFIVASSGDVYRVYDQMHGREPWDGEQPGPLDEDAPLRTRLYPYGTDYEKILVERVALAAGAIVLRLPKVWGPGDHGTLVTAAEQLRAAGQRVEVARSVANWRWTHGHVADVAHAIGLAAGSDVRCRVYNVGERETPSLAARLCADIVEPGCEPLALRVPIANAVDLVMSTDRIRAELGFE